MEQRWVTDLEERVSLTVDSREKIFSSRTAMPSVLLGVGKVVGVNIILSPRRVTLEAKKGHKGL